MAKNIILITLFMNLLGYKAHCQDDTLKIRQLQELRNHYISRFYTTQNPTNLDSALHAIQQALTLSEAIKNNQLRFQSMKYMGYTCLMMGDTVKALECELRTVAYYCSSGQPKQAINSWIVFGEVAGQIPYHSLAMASYQNAKKLLERYPAVDNEANIRYHIATEYSLTGDTKAAEIEALAIVVKFRNSNINLDKIYWLLASDYRARGNFKEALNYSLASIRDLEKYNDKDDPDLYYGELALIYDALGEYEKSILYYKKALALREEASMSEEYLFRTAGFIIKNYLKLGKVRAAMNEALGLEQRHPPESAIGRIFNAQNKAYCYDALKKYDQAEKDYLRVVAELELSFRESEFLYIAYEDISNFYLARNNPVKASFYAEKMDARYSAPEHQKRFQWLHFRIDSVMGNYAAALRHYISYTNVKDSIFNESKSKEIAELQLKYETEKKENDILSLTKDGQSQREQLKQASKVQNLILAVIALLLIVLVLLYTSFRNNKRKSREIDRKNAVLNVLVSEKDDLLQEKEWLIKEVHHRVKNNLQIVMGLLQRQSSYIDNKVALAAIQNSEHRMHSIALIHQKLYQSENFKLVSMPDYISEMIGYLQESFDLGARISFEKNIEPIDFEIATAVPLGLIMNEAITNAIKYAFPPHGKGCIQIALNQTGEDTYTLRISDNGRGLAPDFDILQSKSMGFNLIRGLSKQLAGRFMIEGVQGVAIRIDFKTEQYSR